MKSKLLLIYLLLTVALPVLAQQPADPLKSARYIAPGDPNLDATWNWTLCCSGHTMYYSLNGATPVQLNNVQVPFYTSGHALADAASNDAKDMWQQDGWMLVYRDFGTATSAPAYPFFILYNKYKGIFRAMVYNAPGLLNTYFRMTLSFRDTSPKSAIFAFAENRYNLQYLNSYDANATLVAISRVNQGQGWIHGDFILTGYVPSLNQSTVLHLDVTALNESSLTATGTLTLDEVIKSSPAGSDFNGQFQESVNKGYKAYKSVATAAKDLAKSAAGIGSVFGLMSAFSDVASLVEFLISGNSKSSGREPMSFKGTTKIDGTLSTAFQVIQYDFALFQSMPNLPDYYRPVQAIPWGVVNVVDALRMNCTTSESDPYECDYGCSCMTVDIEETCYGPTVNYVSNHANLGMRLVSVQARPIYPGNSSSSYQDISLVPQNSNYGYYNYSECYGFMGSRYAVAIGIKFEYEILSATKNYDTKLIIYKKYHFQDNSSGRLSTYTAYEDKEEKGLSLFPNPFSEKVRIIFNAPKDASVEVNIFDSQGRKLQTYREMQPISNGVRYFEWDGKSSAGTTVSSGVYITEIKINGLRRYTKKLLKN